MTLDIQALLRRIARQDETALAVLYAEYSTPVYSLALYVLRNPALAQEVMQDTFMKVWNNPHAYDPGKGQFSSWLLTVTRHTAIDRLRQEIRHTGKDVPLEDNLLVDDEAALSAHDAEKLRDLLRELPPEQCTVIQLVYFRGYTHSELADHLGVPLGTVKTRLRLGLQKLKGLMSK
jgi:RNA polymerase sigma-70 factor (ECF subfamily)